MVSLDVRHTRALDVLDECAAAIGRAAFVRTALPLLHGLLDCDEISFCEVSPEFDAALGADAFPTAPHTLPLALETYRTRIAEHPLSAHQRRHRDPHARRLSELVTNAELRRSPFWADFYRERELAFADYAVLCRDPTRTVVVGLGRRHRDYSDDEHQFFDRLRRPLGALYLAARARENVRAPADGTGLTRTETRVARLVSSGLSNRAVADQLGVSVKAVEQHLTHVYRRLGVRSRVQLVLALDGSG